MSGKPFALQIVEFSFCDVDNLFGSNSVMRESSDRINHLAWKSLLISSCPTVNLTLPSSLLNHVPKHHIYTTVHVSRNDNSTTALGSLFSVPDNPFSTEPFPNIQPELPLAQLEAISSCPSQTEALISEDMASDAMLNTIFKREVDQDSDGCISFKEFESAMKYGQDEVSPVYVA